MEMSVEKADDVAMVTPVAEYLDASNYQDFKNSIEPTLEAERKVLVVISKLRFVDSSGLGAILSCLRKLTAHGGDLKLLCEKSKPVRMFFELVRMNQIIDIVNTKEEALAAFHKGQPV